MAAYVPIMQKQLAWSLYLQYTRQQEQQQHQGAAGQEQGQEGAAGVAAAIVQSLIVNVREFLSFIAAAERPGAAMRERFARVLNRSIDEASSSSTTGELASVQAVRQLVQGVPEEGCLMQGRFSLGNWKKHLNACTYLQQQQQHILLGKTRGGSEGTA
jgi:hypothetical protein